MDVGTLRFQIIAAVGLALLLLVTATTLSAYKPWGKTWFGRRKAVTRSEDMSRANQIEPRTKQGGL